MNEFDKIMEEMKTKSDVELNQLGAYTLDIMQKIAIEKDLPIIGELFLLSAITLEQMSRLEEDQLDEVINSVTIEEIIEAGEE